jgi:hypothetical protein
MTSLRRLQASIAIALVFAAAPAVASDAIVYWNGITAQAVLAAPPPSRPGPSSVLDWAMVSAAMHDAVQAIEGKYEPYATSIPGASGSSSAAAAKAAHDVLVHQFPDQLAFLDSTYHAYLAANVIPEDDAGVAVGTAAAAGLIAARAGDGSFPNPPLPPFIGGTDPGEWRPVTEYLPPPPPSGAPMAAEFLAFMKPFVLTSPDQFRPAQGPPALTSGKYTKDYNEVKRLGGDVNSDRTQAQTDLATFFNMNFLTQFNLALRDIANAHITDIADSARLFALADLAMADAGITAWDSKRHFVYWRPVTAIQLGDTDGNAKTDPDVNWHPYINTPPYPEYTSGANNVSGSTTKILELFFQTNDFTFELKSNNPQAVPPSRTYTRFTDLADDVLEVRILQGIHFRTADVLGRKQGRHVAKYVFKHALKPVGGGGDGDSDGDDDGDDED